MDFFLLLTNPEIVNIAKPRLWDTSRRVCEVGSTIPELWADGFLVRFLVVGGGRGGCRLPRALGLQAYTLQAYTVHISAIQFWDGILERHFQSRFLGIHSSLLRLEFLSGFLTPFFRSTKCYSWTDSSLVSRVFCKDLLKQRRVGMDLQLAVKIKS